MKLFKGKPKGIIHTRDITLDDIRAVFFPKSFYEKYKYLGSVPYREEGDLFLAMKPLVIAMDKKAKPFWCPRWFLRFLHLFGSDNSIVRVRNAKLHNLEKKITKGYLIFDYKTKWSDYDLRISVSGDKEISMMTREIETRFYQEGRISELIREILDYDPNFEFKEKYSITELQEELKKLEGDE
jgi:hypothetical protein